MRHIHSGDMNYLNRLHRQYGRNQYKMVVLKQWSDGKVTVEFVKNDTCQEQEYI